MTVGVRWGSEFPSRDCVGDSSESNIMRLPVIFCLALLVTEHRAIWCYCCFCFMLMISNQHESTGFYLS